MSSDNKYTLKPSLREKFKGIIWKIETDDRTEIVAIETRDIESHTAAFSAFNFNTGKTLFKELVIEDSWNWSLDRVTNGTIFLHGYITEKSPEHKGIIAINQNGKTVWQQFNKTLDTISDEGLIAYNPSIQPRILELISPLDGSLLKYGIKTYHPVNREIIVPEIVYNPSFMTPLLPENIAGPVFFASFGEKRFYSFHTGDGRYFSQKLLITEGNKLVLDQFLETGIQKLNPEAFFIQHKHLFCISNKKQEIVAYLV